MTDADWLSAQSAEAEAGQLILLITTDDKRYLLRLTPGKRFHCHLGSLYHDDLIGQRLGATVHSQLGHPILLMEPSLSDLMTHVRRSTQIIYPKDAAYLIHRLNLQTGCHVIEAGTGSGALTIAMARTVAPTGRVYSYEIRQDNYNTALENLRRVGLQHLVTLHQRSIIDGFAERGADAVFLDLRTPWIFLDAVRSALRPGGYFASLLPTTNQVIHLLQALEQNSFADIAVEELMLRAYKPVPDRLRPDDNMVGHTGFLISARPVDDPDNPGRWLSVERKRYQARKEMEERIAEREKMQNANSAGDRRKYPKLPLP